MATFIGSPEINLYKGRVVIEDGRPRFQGKGFSLALGPIPRGLEEEEIELGIRPEDVAVPLQRGQDPDAAVEMISDMGPEKLIHARLGEEGLTLRAPKDTRARTGDRIPLAFDPARFHLFRQGRRVDGSP